MKEVLELIEKKKQEFGKLPFFNFLQDKSVHPKQRLAWAPCVAPFAMSFGELNKRVLRVEPTNNKLQELINKHTYEDAHHWKWFLQDLEKLELNHSLKFSEALKFLWSEDLQKTRKLSQDLFSLCNLYDEPILRLVIIEVIEATGHIGQTIVAKVTQELQEITQKEYRYFGEHHLTVENGHLHLAGVNNVEQLLESLEMTEEQKVKAFEIVDQIFESFTEFVQEMLAYAKKQCRQQYLDQQQINFQDFARKSSIQNSNKYPMKNAVLVN
jgi:hypothetical protein